MLFNDSFYDIFADPHAWYTWDGGAGGGWSGGDDDAYWDDDYWGNNNWGDDDFWGRDWFPYSTSAGEPDYWNDDIPTWSTNVYDLEPRQTPDYPWTPPTWMNPRIDSPPDGPGPYDPNDPTFRTDVYDTYPINEVPYHPSDPPEWTPSLDMREIWDPREPEEPDGPTIGGPIRKPAEEERKPPPERKRRGDPGEPKKKEPFGQGGGGSVNLVMSPLQEFHLPARPQLTPVRLDYQELRGDPLVDANPRSPGARRGNMPPPPFSRAPEDVMPPEQGVQPRVAQQARTAGSVLKNLDSKTKKMLDKFINNPIHRGQRETSQALNMAADPIGSVMKFMQYLRRPKSASAVPQSAWGGVRNNTIPGVNGPYE